jgi:predicted nucleic acid-binding protein
MEKMIIISDDKVKSKIKEAIQIMKDIDIKDAPILAAALAVPNDGIWSHDKHFEKQNKIRIFLDQDLIQYT